MQLGDQHRIVATESERIGHGNVSLRERPGGQCDIVEVTLRIGVPQVRGWRRDALAQRFDGGDEFERPGRAHEMAMQRLGGADRDVPCVFPEYLANRVGLDHVAGLGAGTVAYMNPGTQ